MNRLTLAPPIGFIALVTWAGLAQQDTLAPRWYRGNTHAHTLWSDGDAAPELVVAWYREHGYDFLVLSDHDRIQQGERWYRVGPDSPLTAERVAELRERFGDEAVQLRDAEAGRAMRLWTLEELRRRFEAPGSFLLMSGEEITASFEDAEVHVNGLNLAEPIAPLEGATLLDTLQNNVDAIVEQGRRLDRPVLAHVNHPNFRWSLTHEELAALRGERFFEVYNGHPATNDTGDAENPQRPGTERMWDLALTARLDRHGLPPLFGLATDDGHSYFTDNPKAATPGRGWIQVRAESLDAESLIEALNRGDFYASSGVELRDVQHADGRLEVEIEATAGVGYTTRFIGTRRDSSPAEQTTAGELLLETEANPAIYTFKGDELYVRATVTSTRVHANPATPGELERAWVQPVLPESE